MKSTTIVALLALLMGLLAPALAHRPLAFGAVLSSSFASPGTALVVPRVNMSWAVDVVLDCSSPVFWVKFNSTAANQGVHVTIATPYVASLADQRATFTLFGPGLPKPKNKPSGEQQQQRGLPPAARTELVRALVPLD